MLHRANGPMVEVGQLEEAARVTLVSYVPSGWDPASGRLARLSSLRSAGLAADLDAPGLGQVGAARYADLQQAVHE